MTLFVESAQAAGLTPSLIIDEANLVFSPEDSETMEAKVIAERNRAVLNLITSMTKEGNQLNVILVTSERPRRDTRTSCGTTSSSSCKMWMVSLSTPVRCHRRRCASYS